MKPLLLLFLIIPGLVLGGKSSAGSKTKEVAISDSYEKGFEERWLTEEKKEAIGGGYFWIISW